MLSDHNLVDSSYYLKEALRAPKGSRDRATWVKGIRYILVTKRFKRTKFSAQCRRCLHIYQAFSLGCPQCKCGYANLVI